VCSIPSQAWVRRCDNKNHADVDAAIIADHLIMAATDEGLGTCWICAFDTLAARKAFNIPDNAEPVVLITLGYAADQPTEKKRKNLRDIVSFETW
jgi:nitroreductase